MTNDLAALVSTGNQQNRALRNSPCACVYQFPYDPRGDLLKQCERCRAMKAWKALVETPAAAVTP